MGIKRLLIDSQIQGVWYGHTKTGPDRRRDKEGAANEPCPWLATGQGQGRQPAAACAVV